MAWVDKNKSNDNDKLGNFKISHFLQLCNCDFLFTTLFLLLHQPPFLYFHTPYFPDWILSLNFLLWVTLFIPLHFNTTSSSFSCKFLNFSYLGIQKYLSYSFPFFYHIVLNICLSAIHIQTVILIMLVVYVVLQFNFVIHFLLCLVKENEKNINSLRLKNWWF